MRVLVAFEESQEVCIAFRERGHEAFSNDLKPCSGGHPEWHLQMDFHEALWKMANDGGIDLLIAFPPCQKLSKAGGAHWWKPEFKKKQDEALKLILFILSLGGREFWDIDEDCLIPKIAIENPVGKINTAIRKPNQRIQPWQFGHPYIKETCLWLRRLPPLRPTQVVKPTANWVKPGNKRPWRRFWEVQEGAKGDTTLRSRTFPGIAKAMAEQWGGLGLTP